MTNVEINTVEIAQKLYEKLKGTGWDEALRTYLLGDSFQTLLNELVKLRNEGKRITPSLKNVFRAFQECPTSTVKVVMIGQDPYPQFNVADGIAFSCGNTKYPEASLRYMLKEISLTVPENQKDPVQSADLKRWSNQGLLMINCALTTNIGEIGKHYELWSDFITHVLDYLAWNNQGIVYVMLGKKAQEWDDCIYDSNYKIHVSHPASAAYNKESRWNSNNLFNQVNEYLTSVNQTSIIW
jgi:uracil-DNA glycosylase